MSYVIGTLLALVVGVSSTVIGFDRDRAMYPVVMIVIAFYYVLFALMGGSSHALFIELAVAAAFISAAAIGFKWSLWLVVAALAGHGVFDVLHPHLYENAGVPEWWPPFCIAYDVVAAAYLAWLIVSDRVPSRGLRL